MGPFSAGGREKGVTWGGGRREKLWQRRMLVGTLRRAVGATDPHVPPGCCGWCGVELPDLPDWAERVLGLLCNSFVAVVNVVGVSLSLVQVDGLVRRL